MSFKYFWEASSVLTDFVEVFILERGIVFHMGNICLKRYIKQG